MNIYLASFVAFVVGILVGAVTTDYLLEILVRKALGLGVLTQETLSSVSEESVWKRLRGLR